MCNSDRIGMTRIQVVLKVMSTSHSVRATQCIRVRELRGIFKIDAYNAAKSRIAETWDFLVMTIQINKQCPAVKTVTYNPKW